jgi:hypothetical protein
MASAVATKQREKHGRRQSTEHIASLADMAVPSSATVETAMNRFRNTGLWPVDRFVFTDGDFATSTVTDRPETIKQVKITAHMTEHD